MASTKERTRRSTCESCWHPLLPAFSARIIIGLRTLLGIACVATLTLSPITSNKIQGQLLLGVGFITAIKSTLGLTIQTATRLYLGGAIAATYCIPIVKYCPRNIYFAVGATTILVLFIVYTDLPVTVRRFTIVPTCIILLQWFNKPQIDTLFILQIVASLTLGGTLAVLVTCIPLPVVPTAFRELTMRMRFIARQTRREITAILLLISEHHNKHLLGTYDPEIGQARQKIDASDDNDNGIEMAKDSYRNDHIVNRSTSFDDLSDDQLLTSDIQDLHSLVNDELKQMQRALSEISYEPYFLSLKILNLIRRLLRHIPFIKKYIKRPSTLQLRLSVWSTGLASIQRIVSSMLILEHHQHAFVGQRGLINAICLLLDSTFTFLDSTLPYTTASTNYFNTAQIIGCRAEVEEALEDFFETYTQVRENPRYSTISNSDAIRLNTFLLLTLRLVHATITAAETSETPGAHIGDSPIPTEKVSKLKKPFNCKNLCHNIAAYIGIRPSFGKLVRSIKTSLSVLLSALIVFSFRERLQAYGWVYWAPMTTALVSDSSEGSTLRTSFQRLMAVLLGSTYAYIVVLVTQNRIAVGICICIFVGLMGYLKTDPRKEYFASVCAQSASIITFLSNQQGQMSASNKAVLARTTLTFLGIFIHLFVSNLFLPITARALTKKKVSLMIKNVSAALKSSCDDFCSFIGPSIKDQQTTSPSNKTSCNLIKTLGETERIIDSLPTLLEEALNEPNFWKRPFIQVKDRYEDIAKCLRRITTDIRFVDRCTTILKAESKLHFAQEAKWLTRRTSLAQVSMGPDSKPTPAWTMTDLRKEQQLQDDLDIPLTIFMTYSANATPTFQQKGLVSNNSSASLRLTHTTLYRPVLEHIRTLENHIQQVISLAGQVIEKQATVDVGSLELQQLCRDDSFDEQQSKILKTQKTLNRNSSFYVVPKFEAKVMSTNHYKFFSCCDSVYKDIEPLPSLRNAVDLMIASLIQFLYANNRFIRTEFISNQSIGDVLAFHTLSYALKDMVEATTNLAKNARRIKHIDTGTLVRTAREEKILQQQTV